MGLNIRGKVTISAGGSISVPGSCHEINLNGAGWSYNGNPATIYNVKLYDSSIDIPFVTPLIPSWYYSSSGAHIRSMYCERRPSQDSSGDRNQALILFVANDNTNAQWVYGYFQFDASTGELSLEGEHYSDPPIKAWNNPTGPWTWSYDNGLTKVPMLHADETAYFNTCPKGAGYLMAPGDGIFYSLTIT
jgi:hypothetical protein